MTANFTCPTSIAWSIIGGIYGGVSQIGCIVATAGGGSVMCTLMTFSIADAAGVAYNAVASSDDHRLLTKLISDDCGGLSKMVSNVEGCFRKYVMEAICRLDPNHRYRLFQGSQESPNYHILSDRFTKCFSNRQEPSCNDWFFRTDVF